MRPFSTPSPSARFTPQRRRPRGALLSSAGLLAFLAGSAHAQIRIAPPAASVTPPSANLAQTLFGEEGFFRIAGGVLLDGSAQFLLERDGVDQTLGAGDVLPVGLASGGMAIQAGGRLYPIATMPGLICPLGRFVARDGRIAYTVPRFMDSAARLEMDRAGLANHRLAREFVGTPFASLLRAADFAATQPLPDPLAGMLVATMNDDTGLSGYALHAAYQLQGMIGSVLNTDSTTLYRAYLLAPSGRMEISGVPLRYYWAYDNGAAGVFSVEAMAETWPAGTSLSPPGATPSQYDVINFYQVAGVLRQLHQDQPAAFQAALATACAGTQIIE